MTEHSAMDRFTSAFLEQCRTQGGDTWADAGRAIETAHRAKLPRGWSLRSAVALLLAVIVGRHVQ